MPIDTAVSKDGTSFIGGKNARSAGVAAFVAGAFAVAGT